MFRKETAILMAILMAYIMDSKSMIWFYLKPLPAWWKILLAVGAGVFFTGALIWAAGLEFLLFQLLDIHPL